MTTRKNKMLTSENLKEVNNMSIQIPINKTYFKQWSLFVILKGGTTPAFREDGTAYEKPKAYTLKKVPLTELRKVKGYEKFADLANKLYKNYTPEGYIKFFDAFQHYNDVRQFEFVSEFEMAKADYITRLQAQEIAEHYGEIPSSLFKLTDNQIAILLDRARICYGLEPEYIQLQTKEVYRHLPKRLVKDENETGVTYYTQEELDKVGYVPTEFVDVIGKFEFYNQKLNRLAELAVIRDASWMAQFDNTENDLRVHIEIEGDDKHNRMIPVVSFETFELEKDIEYVDFLCDIYGLDDNGDLFTNHKKFQWSSED